MVNRAEYLRQLIANRDRKIIKVVTGVRRCGKSTLFALYMNWLRQHGVAEEQIISINLEDLDAEELREYHALYAYVKERLLPAKPCYVFIDEVQNCPSFEKAVDSLFLRPNVDLYLTGSNAFMLSGELATLLSGRYITVDLLPFSFREYCQTKAAAGKSRQTSLNDYLRYGSFPYLTELPQRNEDVSPYLEGIYSTILLKDVAQRAGITDVSVLESIVKMLASSVGSPISAKKLSDTLCSAGRKISVNTVGRYLRALTDSYLFYEVNRYDIKGRQYLKTLSKYYMVDTGLRNHLVVSSAADLGHQIENVVYLELLRRGYKVNIGKLAATEVDFVASSSDGFTYVQVSASVLGEETLRRELAPLQQIRDHHPKLLLTLDEIGSGANYDGIRQYNLVDWLLGE